MAGNLAIGTTTATETLTVNSSSNTTVRVENTSTSTARLQLINNDTSPNNNNWSILAGYLNTRNLSIRDNLGGERLRIISNGYIGINDPANIGSNLQINGNAAIGYSASTAAPTNGLAVSGALLIGTTTDAGYKLDVNGTGRFSSTLNVFNGNIIVRNDTGSTYRGLSIGATTSDSNEYGYIKYQPNIGELKIWGSPASFGGKTTFWNNDIQWLNVSSANALTFTGAATFSAKVSVKGGTNAGGYYMDYQSDATSRSFRISSEHLVFADFVIQRSTTRTGTTYEDLLYFDANRAATFSSSVTATSFFESSDSRLKTLIQDNYQTKGIASITPKLYTKNGKVELGYYAQDLVGILDSAVSKGSDDMLSLSYREVHTAKIYALEQEIKELKAKMN
jgi:hypothetical protein